MKYISKSLKDTKDIAKIFSRIVLKKPLLLNGELGAGKTTLVKFIAEFLNIEDVVTSPTFNKMNIYPNLIHIDAYNMSGSLEEYEEYFDNKPIIIEWSNNLDLNFSKYLKVNVYLRNDLHIYEIIEEK